jgi:hypothetical protein
MKLVGTRSLSSGALSRDPLALPTPAKPLPFFARTYLRTARLVVSIKSRISRHVSSDSTQLRA